jgi:hypothetical protein
MKKLILESVGKLSDEDCLHFFLFSKLVSKSRIWDDRVCKAIRNAYEMKMVQITVLIKKMFLMTYWNRRYDNMIDYQNLCQKLIVWDVI